MAWGRRVRLVGTAVAVGIVVATALAPVPAGAAIDTATFCAGVPGGQSGFGDLGAAGPHGRNVECLKGAGVASGTTATAFSPSQHVTRGQMATFVANLADRAFALDAAGGPAVPALPSAAVSEDRFGDDEGHVHEASINRLTQAGIVSGTSATTFDPNGLVNRERMATFLANAAAFLRGAPLPVGGDAFADDEASAHEANINRIATADIADGVTPATFQPQALLTRAQMASLLVRTFADLLADGFVVATTDVGTATPEAPAGAQQTDVDVTQEAADRFVGDPLGALSSPRLTYAYDGFDAFALDPDGGGPQPAQPTTYAAWEGELSPGDVVQVTYAPDPTRQSQWTLLDLSPAPPAITDVNGDDDNTERVNLAVTPTTPALPVMDPTDQVVVRRADAGPDASCAGAADNGAPVVIATRTKGDDANRSTTTVLELTDDPVFADPATDFDVCYTAQVVVDGEASAPSAVEEADLRPDAGAPVVVGVTPDEVNDGAGSTTTVRFRWNEAVTVRNASRFTINPAGQPSLLLTGTAAAVSGSTVVVTFGGTLTDANPDITWEWFVASDAVRDTAATPTPNAAASGTFPY